MIEAQDGQRRRTVTWSAPLPPPASFSGLQAVQAVADGTLPLPPVARLLGLTMSHVEAGLVRVALQPAEFHYNPIGSVHGGIAATLLQAVTEAAIRSTLPPGRSSVAVDLQVNYVRAMTIATGPVTGEGRVVHAGRQVALAEGRVTDAAGRLYATATATALVLDAPGHKAATTQGLRQREIAWADPLASARQLAGLTGLEALRGRAFDPPIALLTGMTLQAVDPGCVQMHLPPGEHLSNQAGVVDGGMLATLLDSVMGCAVHTTLPAGRGYTTLELKLTFLLPVVSATGSIVGTGQVLHADQRMATAEARAVDGAGRLCATATTTCLVFDARTGT